MSRPTSIGQRVAAFLNRIPAVRAIDDAMWRFTGRTYDKLAIDGLLPRFDGQCWLCLRGGAETREHKFKKGILAHLHGRGPYLDSERRLVHIVDGAPAVQVQGLNSPRLKHEKSLCAPCNNHKTRPHDDAHQAFAEYVFDQSLWIASRRVLDLSIPFPCDTTAHTDRLLGALAKQLGCRIRDAIVTHEVPFALRFAVSRGWHSSRNLQVLVFRDGTAVDKMFHRGPLSALISRMYFGETYQLGYLCFQVMTGALEETANLELLTPNSTRVRVYDFDELPPFVQSVAFSASRDIQRVMVAEPRGAPS